MESKEELISNLKETTEEILKIEERMEEEDRIIATLQDLANESHNKGHREAEVSFDEFALQHMYAWDALKKIKEFAELRYLQTSKEKEND